MIYCIGCRLCKSSSINLLMQLWRQRAQNSKSYDYLTLFHYPWCYMWNPWTKLIEQGGKQKIVTISITMIMCMLWVRQSKQFFDPPPFPSYQFCTWISHVTLTRSKYKARGLFIVTTVSASPREQRAGFLPVLILVDPRASQSHCSKLNIQKMQIIKMWCYIRGFWLEYTH